ASAAGSKRDPNGSTCGSGLSVSRPRSRAVVSPFHSATSPWAHSCTTTLNTSAGRIRKNVGSKCNRTLLPGWIRKAFVGDYRDLRGESRLASARAHGVHDTRMSWRGGRWCGRVFLRSYRPQDRELYYRTEATW